MKTLLISIFTSILLFGVVSTATTQNSAAKTADPATTGQNFVDKDKDGICDKQVKGTQKVQGRNFVDANKDGTCDNRGKRGNNVKGAAFTDKNNDGVCDNKGNRNRGNGNCYRNGQKGNGNGNRCGNGCGQGRRIQTPKI